MIRRRALLASGAALAAGPASAAADTLRVGLVNHPPTLRPFENSGSSQVAVKLCMHRGLLSYSADGALQPELAESWRMEGPAAYVFQLREAATFHDDTPVTAEDVKATIEQIAGGKTTAYLRPDFGIVERVEVEGPKRLRIVLRQNSAPFPHLLASYHAPVLPAKADPAGQPPGAGPYRFAAQERGQSITLERHAGFYKPGRPRMQRLQFTAYADETLRVAALEAGDVDIIEGLPWQSFTAIEANPRLVLDATTGPFMYLTFNARSGPFTDARVRRAVGFAVKREEVVRAALYGRGTPLEALPYPQQAGVVEDPVWRYDPTRARALLAEAGVAEGFACTLLSTTNPTLHQATAEVVQHNLAEIGIKVALELRDWSTRVAMGNRGQYEFSVMGSVLNWPDPDAAGAFIAGPAAYPRSFGFASPRIDALLQAGRQELDPVRRRAIYAALQQEAAAEVPFVGLAWRSQAFAMRRGITGFRNMPGSLTFYAPFTLEDAALE